MRVNISCATSTVSFGGRFGQGVTEGGAGGDAELGEDLVEVGGDRTRGEEEAGRDFLVGVARRGEQGDLALLRGEGGQAGLGRGDGDAGGSQFPVRAVRPGGRSELAEGLRGGGQLTAGVGGALYAAQVEDTACEGWTPEVPRASSVPGVPGRAWSRAGRHPGSRGPHGPRVPRGSSGPDRVDAPSTGYEPGECSTDPVLTAASPSAAGGRAGAAASLRQGNTHAPSCRSCGRRCRWLRAAGAAAGTDGITATCSSGLAVRGRREQPQLSRAAHGRGTVLGLKLGVDVADVGVDGVHRDQ